MSKDNTFGEAQPKGDPALGGGPAKHGGSAWGPGGSGLGLHERGTKNGAGTFRESEKKKSIVLGRVREEKKQKTGQTKLKAKNGGESGNPEGERKKKKKRWEVAFQDRKLGEIRAIREKKKKVRGKSRQETKY